MVEVLVALHRLESMDAFMWHWPQNGASVVELAASVRRALSVIRMRRTFALEIGLIDGQ